MGKRPVGSICVLPVVSNLGELASPLPLASRKPQMVLYDNLGPKPRTRTLAVNLIRHASSKMGMGKLVLLGRGDAADWSATGLKVEAAGFVAPEAASRLLAESRVGCLDYFDGYLGKSGIFAAYSAHGLLPLLVLENHSEADGLEMNQHFWAADTMPRETGPEAQQQIASQAHQWYNGHTLAAAGQAYVAALEDLAC